MVNFVLVLENINVKTHKVKTHKVTVSLGLLRRTVIYIL